MIIEGFSFPTFERQSVMAMLWQDEDDAYTVAWLHDGTLQTYCMYDDDEVVELVESLFDFTYDGSGHKLDDLRETLNQYVGKWFVLPLALLDSSVDSSRHEISKFESLHIGKYRHLYERQVPCEQSDKTVRMMRSPLSPGDHELTGEKQYTVYMDRFWTRVSNSKDRIHYFGPYESELEAIKDAVKCRFEWENLT
jgi:hypothetical protein